MNVECTWQKVGIAACSKDAMKTSMLAVSHRASNSTLCKSGLPDVLPGNWMMTVVLVMVRCDDSRDDC